MAFSLEQNKFWQETLAILEEIADAGQPSILQKWLLRKMDGFRNLPNDPNTILQSWNTAQRVILIHKAGLADNRDALAHISKTTYPLCGAAPPLPVDQDLLRRVAAPFLKARHLSANPNTLLLFAADGGVIAEDIVAGFIQAGRPFDMQFYDYEFMTRLMEVGEVAGLEQAGEYLAAKFGTDRIGKANVIRATPTADVSARESKMKDKVAALTKWRQAYLPRALGEDGFYTLAMLPTPEDALKDGVPYPEYLRHFCLMADQPGPEIEAAQAIAIEILNKTKKLRIVNDDGTDITFDLEGQRDGEPFYRATFANSVHFKNVPGSEFFSAPFIDGVNGIVVAKGNFNFDGADMEDVTIRYEKGVMVDSDARVGRGELRRILAKPSFDRVGEIAIGTNAWLQRHVRNGAMVEKIGGSFHMAAGPCYKFTQYNGVPVCVNNGNGNEAKEMHWDIAAMLRGKNGKIYTDGELFQDNGRFVDPRLAVLNDGWAAVPVALRPAIWKQVEQMQRLM